MLILAAILNVRHFGLSEIIYNDVFDLTVPEYVLFDVLYDRDWYDFKQIHILFWIVAAILDFDHIRFFGVISNIMDIYSER